jgi:AraC-like DNA-binding protein
MLFIVFGVAYSALRQKEIYPVNAGQEEEIMDIETITPFSDQKRKVVSDIELVEFKTALNQLMKEKMPYKDPEINLIKLAAMLKMTPHQLSYVINTGFNENFFQFINRHRVEAARDLIAKGNLNNFSLLGIAFESGFNSKTTFNNTFKKITSQTPTEFRKSCSGL